MCKLYTMTTQTNIIDMTDRTATAELPEITAQNVRDFNRGFARAMREDADGLSPDALRDLLGDATFTPPADDTVRIPTYMGEPMLPPVPGAPTTTLHGRPGAVPTGQRRAAAILAAMSLGAAVAPIVIR